MEPGSDNLTRVVIYTDGACRGNPGPGAWACVLKYGPYRKELCGGEKATTNNRMELQAAVEALNALKKSCIVEFYTDSRYVQEGVSDWMPKWKENGWRRRENRKWKPVKNEDLWRALDTAQERHQVEWNWVRGHAGDPENERCDQLANEEIGRIERMYGKDELKKALGSFRRAGS
ncbi:MAG TPA: ribonuclease HI [Candidatus Brocadiia bacterium]|nr:ribonuclease HI [Candidatus Brocadiia bacterium]